MYVYPLPQIRLLSRYDMHNMTITSVIVSECEVNNYVCFCTPSISSCVRDTTYVTTCSKDMILLMEDKILLIKATLERSTIMRHHVQTGLIVHVRKRLSVGSINDEKRCFCSGVVCVSLSFPSRIKEHSESIGFCARAEHARTLGIISRAALNENAN
jgi:hypothetical protein